MTHQTHDAKGRRYVQITFKPHDARRKVTRWALKVRPGYYVRADKDGGEWADPKAPSDVERIEIILTGQDVIERPAGVSLHYCKLEVLP